MIDLSSYKGFELDIKSRTVSAYPLIIIGKDTDNPIYISSVKETLADNGVTLKFKDYNLKISNIKESLNVKAHTIKISNVSVSLSNPGDINSKLSDTFINLINTNVEIYYKTQSCKTLQDCLPLFKGLIRRYDHSFNTIDLVIEDLTDSTFHKDVPIANLGTRKECFSKKYFNKYIPIVYGSVDKSPMIPYVDNVGDQGQYYISLIADDVEDVTRSGRNLSIYGFGDSELNPEDRILPTGATNGLETNHPLYIYKGDYFKVLQNYEHSLHDVGMIIDPNTGLNVEAVIYNDPEQYRIDSSGNFLSIRKKYASGYFQNPPATNELQAFKVHHPNQLEIMRTDLEVNPEGIVGLQSSVINIDTSVYRPEASFDTKEKPSLFFDDIVSNEFDTYSEIPYNELNLEDIEEGLEEFEVNGFETSRIDEVGGIYYPNDSVDGTIAHARMNFLWTIPGWIINNAHLLNSVDALESVRFVSLPSIHHIKEKLIDYINDFSNGILSEFGESDILLNTSSTPIEIVPQYQADAMFANSWAESSGISTTVEQQVAAYSAATGLATDQYPLAPALSPFPMLINEDGSLLGGNQVTSANTSQLNFYFMGYKDVTQEVTIDPITGLYVEGYTEEYSSSPSPSISHKYFDSENPKNNLRVRTYEANWNGNHNEHNYNITFQQFIQFGNRKILSGGLSEGTTPAKFPTTIFKFKLDENHPGNIHGYTHIYVGQWIEETMGAYQSNFIDTENNLKIKWINLWNDSDYDVDSLYNSIDEFPVYTPKQLTHKTYAQNDFNLTTKYICDWNGISLTESMTGANQNAIVSNEAYGGGFYGNGEQGQTRQDYICESYIDNEPGASWFIYMDDDITADRTGTNLPLNENIGELNLGFQSYNGTKVPKKCLIPMNHLAEYTSLMGSDNYAVFGLNTGVVSLFGDNKSSETVIAGDIDNAEKRLSLLFPFSDISNTDVIEDETNMYIYGKLKLYIDADDQNDSLIVNSMTSSDNLLVQALPASGESESNINFNVQNVGDSSIDLISVNGSENDFISGNERLWQTINDSEQEGVLEDNEYLSLDSYLMAEWSNPDDFNALALNYRVFGNVNAKAQISTDIHSFGIIQFSIFEKALDGNLYADVFGRANNPEDVVANNLKYTYENLNSGFSLIKKPSDIIYHFIEKELEQIDVVNRDSWLESRIDSILDEMSFTITNKINSKKLIEDICKNTSLYPKFSNDGQFYFKQIKKTYNSSDITIKQNDVISFNFTRTPIEDVVTMANVKYKKDYESKSLTRQTGFCDAHDFYGNGDNGAICLKENNNQVSGYDYNSMQLTRTSNILNFESHYIRKYSEAQKLRDYLLKLNCNQHTIIKCTLPIKYINLEVGDIVEFDKLYNNTKAYGEDYTKNNTRNNQEIYKYFIVTSVQKSMKGIAIECYQLHNLTSNFFPGLGSLSRRSELGIYGAIVEEGETELFGEQYQYTLIPNGHFTFDDIAIFENIVANDVNYMTSYQKRNADINGNGSIDQYDLNNIIALFTPILIDDDVDEGISENITLGDITGDGIVNVTDIIALVNYIIGAGDLETSQLIAADLNDDNMSNVSDVVAIVNQILGQ